MATRGTHQATVQRFQDTAAFQVRFEALELEIASDRWNRASDPIILRDGWKGRLTRSAKTQDLKAP